MHLFSKGPTMSSQGALSPPVSASAPSVFAIASSVSGTPLVSRTYGLHMSSEAPLCVCFRKCYWRGALIGGPAVEADTTAPDPHIHPDIHLDIHPDVYVNIHMNIHLKRYRCCTICSQKFTDPSSLKRHLQTHLPKHKSNLQFSSSMHQRHAWSGIMKSHSSLN